MLIDKDSTNGRRRNRWAMHTAIAALAIGAFPALAQTESDTVASGDAPIVVTATLREELLQDVPLSITALDSEDLAEMGASDFEDYARTVPGLSFSGTSQNRTKIALRGLTDGPNAFTQPITGIYLDETPISFPGLDPDIRLIDIQRVEILRGPQGTLYGAGSMGGTIRVITNRPDPNEIDWAFHTGVSATRFGGVNFEADGALNIPVARDALAVRAVGYYANEHGYIDDLQLGLEDINHYETYGGRLAVALTPSDDLTFTVTGIFQDSSQGGESRDDIGTPPWTQSTLVAESQEDEFRLINGLIEWTPGGLSFVSSTTYFEQEALLIGDISGLFHSLGLTNPPAPAFLRSDPRVENFIQEVRLSSAYESPFQWLIGGFYSDRQTTLNDANTIPNFDQVSNLPFPIGTDDVLLTDSVSNNEQIAIFGETSYQFSPILEARVGLRWFRNEIDNVQSQRSPILGNVDSAQGGAEESFNPRFVLSLTPNEDVTIYAQAAKGFRQGTPNANIDSVCGPDLAALGFSTTPFARSDTVWNYELGAKTSWLNGDLIVNAAAYTIDWSDIQVRRRLGCGFTLVLNGASARSTGLELEVHAQLAEGLQFDAAAAYTDAEITSGGADLGAFDGEALPNIPDWTFSAALQYETPLNSRFDLFARGDVQYVSDRTNEFSALPTVAQITLDDYALANLRIGIADADDRWSLTAFVSNVTNTRADLFARINVLGESIYRNRPRTIGLEFRIAR